MKSFCTLLAASLVWASLALAAAAQSGEGKLGEFIPAEPPQPAPEIAVSDMAGKQVMLAEFRGKPVLVNFWATWCQPCLREMPSLIRLQDKLGAALGVLAVSEDRGGAKQVAPFVDKHGLGALKIYLDPKSQAGHAFKVRGLPTTILIDAEGKVRGRVEGAAEWDSDKMLAAIRPLLPQGGKAPPLKNAGFKNPAPAPAR